MAPNCFIKTIKNILSLYDKRSSGGLKNSVCSRLALAVWIGPVVRCVGCAIARRQYLFAKMFTNFYPPPNEIITQWLYSVLIYFWLTINYSVNKNYVFFCNTFAPVDYMLSLIHI